MSVQRVGILTSGGDCPGLNPCIRAAVRTALASGCEVCGIQRGWKGLLDDQITPLDDRSVSGIIHRGGTILLSSRSSEFHDPAWRRRAADTLARHGIQGLIVLGGNGSLEGAWRLHSESRLPLVGVPKTIDNDVGGTEYTLGFDTAVNAAMEAIDRIRDTATSHERVFLVEVMGRSRGFLALEVALATGAEDALLPETPTDLERLSARLESYREAGKKSCIIVVAEGDEAGGAYAIASRLEEIGGHDVRVAVLGYLQRGGSPSARDRVVGGLFGKRAVEALLEGAAGQMVTLHRGEITLRDLKLAFGECRELDPERLRLLGTLAR